MKRSLYLALICASVVAQLQGQALETSLTELATKLNELKNALAGTGSTGGPQGETGTGAKPGPTTTGTEKTETEKKKEEEKKEEQRLKDETAQLTEERARKDLNFRPDEPLTIEQIDKRRDERLQENDPVFSDDYKKAAFKLKQLLKEKEEAKKKEEEKKTQETQPKPTPKGEPQATEKPKETPKEQPKSEPKQRAKPKPVPTMVGTTAETMSVEEALGQLKFSTPNKKAETIPSTDVIKSTEANKVEAEKQLTKKETARQAGFLLRALHMAKDEALSLLGFKTDEDIKDEKDIARKREELLKKPGTPDERDKITQAALRLKHREHELVKKLHPEEEKKTEEPKPKPTPTAPTNKPKELLIEETQREQEARKKIEEETIKKQEEEKTKKEEVAQKVVSIKDLEEAVGNIEDAERSSTTDDEAKETFKKNIVTVNSFITQHTENKNIQYSETDLNNIKQLIERLRNAEGTPPTLTAKNTAVRDLENLHKSLTKGGQKEEIKTEKKEEERKTLTSLTKDRPVQATKRPPTPKNRPKQIETPELVTVAKLSEAVNNIDTKVKNQEEPARTTLFNENMNVVNKFIEQHEKESITHTHDELTEIQQLADKLKNATVITSNLKRIRTETSKKLTKLYNKLTSGGEKEESKTEKKEEPKQEKEPTISDLVNALTENQEALAKLEKDMKDTSWFQLNPFASPYKTATDKQKNDFQRITQNLLDNAQKLKTSILQQSSSSELTTLTQTISPILNNLEKITKDFDAFLKAVDDKDERGKKILNLAINSLKESLNKSSDR